MALNTPQFGIPTSLVFGVRDFSKDIRQNQAEDTKALQNAFKFGTQVYDYAQSRNQANKIDEFNKMRQSNRDLDIEDEARLKELEAELAALKGGM